MYFSDKVVHDEPLFGIEKNRKPPLVFREISLCSCCISFGLWYVIYLVHFFIDYNFESFMNNSFFFRFKDRKSKKRDFMFCQVLF